MATVPEFTTRLFDHEWIPAAPSVPRSKQKVMVVLHGKGDSLESFLEIQDELKLPHFNFLLLNAPKKYLGGHSWYLLEPRHEAGVRAARRRLFDLVDELALEGWRPKDIFWMGHSQGALVASDLVLNHPDAFGGVVGVSGYVWFFRGWRARLKRSGALKTPWLFTHGTRDRVIKPVEIREDIAELTSGSVPVLYREFPKGHDFDYSAEVPFIRSWIRRSRPQRFSLRA